MSVVSAIYDTLVDWVEANENTGTVTASLTFNGHTCTGSAFLHPEDKDFFSYKVGRQIATSRARIEILKIEVNKAQQTFNNKTTFYQEVLGFGSKTPADVDPTGAFSRNVMRAGRRLDSLKDALENEEANLRNYLEGQAKAIASIKRFRSKGQDNNN